jgi:CIC family chloride channel protein
MKRLLHPWRHPANWPIFRSDDRLLLIVMGMIVGICSGLAALALNRSLIAMTTWLGPLRHYWWAFVLPGIGAALSSLFLEKIVKEGAGHGVPEVVYAVSRYGGLLRLRSSFSRLVSSCLTIGSGGSAGPEAPVVMSGSAIGANIAKFFSLNDTQRITLVGCGAAGAISAIFNAPIAGMVFTMEVILGEWTALNIIPIAIASVAGAEISRLLQGNQVAFSHSAFQIGLSDILAAAGLAVVTALASVLLTRVLRKSAQAAGRLTLPLWAKAAMGGCGVGGIGLALPTVLGEGYHAIGEMVAGHFAAGLWIVALAAVAKIVATALTLGSGGSGGIFAPCLVIGSFVGLTFHRGLVLLLPGVEWVNEGCFALLGMAGLISGILQAPLTGIFLIVEVTGGYNVILPLIVVSTISTTLSHTLEPASFYFKELVEKGQLLRPGTDARVLSDLTVRELLETDCTAVGETMRLRDFIPVFQQSHRNYFPVTEEKTGRFLGVIHLDDIRPYVFDPELYDVVVLGQVMNTRVPSIRPDADLSEVLHTMDRQRLFSMPVVTANGRFLGMISKATLLDKYRRELMVQTRR